MTRAQVKVPCTRRSLGIDVLTAARGRVSRCFDTHEHVCVAFSGGKDSTVLLHLAVDEARQRGRRLFVLFVDWEAQYKLTVDFVLQCLDSYSDVVDVLWVCLPFRTTNGCSQIEPEWTCWDEEKRDAWVREPPAGAITDPGSLPFYRPRMTFEEFVGAFEAGLGRTGGIVLTGIRAEESRDRFFGTYERLKTESRKPFSTLSSTSPLYDWKTKDIWTYFSTFNKPYNPVYDRMYQAGLKIHQMRICEPYGNEQRKGLALFHVLEPETWPRVCARVAGANTGALYAGESGSVLGNRKVQLPSGYTWQSFTLFLLDTMPPRTADHYRDKVAVYLQWYREHEGGLPDFQQGDTGPKDTKGSWRRVCKAILKNDYWCTSLGFKPTKTAHYEAYKVYMKKRREQWNIFAPR